MITAQIKTPRTTLTHSLLILSMAFILSACNGSDKSDENKKEEDKKEEIAMPVETQKVSTGDITAFYPSTTTLEAEHDASVVAKVGGIVEKFYVEEGEKVSAGQSLVQLETDRLKLELSRTEANLKKLKNDLNRTEAIYKKNMVSSETFEKLKFEYESQLAAYELSKLELTFATVKAPIDGVVSKRYVKVGNMIRTNEAVYHITDFDPLHAVIHVPEKELHKLAVNQLARIQVDARNDKIYEGFVKRISPVVDANSGTFKVTIEVTDPEQNLKPGMFGRLQIVYDTHKETLLIDKNAILSEDSEAAVFVIRENRAFRQVVKTGYINDKQIEVISGLSLGDEVVITGQNSLKNDSLIEVLK